jgi:hypothetical protein
MILWNPKGPYRVHREKCHMKVRIANVKVTLKWIIGKLVLEISVAFLFYRTCGNGTWSQLVQTKL